MDKSIQANLSNLWSQDREAQGKAFQYILKATDKQVDWAYDAWDDLVQGLTHKDNHDRAIGAQVLCNLAKSDPQERMLKDFDALLAVTKDERFVTARHCMQALWKVGAAGVKQQQVYMAGLERRFRECSTEKNCTLIRYDILQSLRNVYDAVNAGTAHRREKIRTKALELIETEDDPKYRKKYMTLWMAK